MEQLKYLIDRLEKIDEKFDEKLDKILVQTTRTNGRVTSLESLVKDHEEKISEQGKNMYVNKGRDKVIWIVIGSVTTVAAMLIQYFINK